MKNSMSWMEVQGQVRGAVVNGGQKKKELGDEEDSRWRGIRTGDDEQEEEELTLLFAFLVRHIGDTLLINVY